MWSLVEIVVLALPLNYHPSMELMVLLLMVLIEVMNQVHL